MHSHLSQLAQSLAGASFDVYNSWNIFAFARSARHILSVSASALLSLAISYLSAFIVWPSLEWRFEWSIIVIKQTLARTERFVSVEPPHFFTTAPAPRL
jgi:hypothetical protein